MLGTGFLYLGLGLVHLLLQFCIRSRTWTGGIHTGLQSLQLNLTLVELGQTSKCGLQISFTLLAGVLKRNVVLSLLLGGERASKALGFHLCLQRSLGLLGVAVLFALGQASADPADRTKAQTTNRAFDKRFFVALDVLGVQYTLGAACDLLGGSRQRFLRGFSQTFSTRSLCCFFANRFPHLRCGTGVLGHLLNNLELAIGTQRVKQLSRYIAVKNRRQATRQGGETRFKLVGLLVDVLKNFRGVHSERAKVHPTIHGTATSSFSSFLDCGQTCTGDRPHRLSSAKRSRTRHTSTCDTCTQTGAYRGQRRRT